MDALIIALSGFTKEQGLSSPYGELKPFTPCGKLFDLPVDHLIPDVKRELLHYLPSQIWQALGMTVLDGAA
jgi:hypothetical protein